MTDIQERLAVINGKIHEELLNRARLSDAMAKCIVMIWMGVAVFFGFALSEPQWKVMDLSKQEVSHAYRR